jgi:hypothetical protein
VRRSVLAPGPHGHVHVLGDGKALDAFAGQKVNVSGTLGAKTNTIQVDAITLARAQ